MPNPSHTSFPFPETHETSDGQLEALGGTAIAACSPTNPPADAATFLGELVKDGIPSLIGSKSWEFRTDAARKAGDEYLNAQFGWRPFLSELIDFGKLTIDANAVLAQYERDSGKVVRRRYEFPLETSYQEDDITGSLGSNLPWGMAGDGFCNGNTYGRSFRMRKIVRRRWFSGAFTYYLPTGYDSRSTMDRIALLSDRFGLHLTPNLVWELGPWSWAVDWFSNTGDVIKNISNIATYGLILRYGYIMEHTTVSDTYTQKGAIDNNGRPFPIDPITLVTETKKRRQANPFGFGVSWDGLTDFQASILAALGISKSS
jgi:hypothetical protein